MYIYIYLKMNLYIYIHIYRQYIPKKQTSEASEWRSNCSERIYSHHKQKKMRLGFADFRSEVSFKVVSQK